MGNGTRCGPEKALGKFYSSFHNRLADLQILLKNTTLHEEHSNRETNCEGSCARRRDGNMVKESRLKSAAQEDKTEGGKGLVKLWVRLGSSGELANQPTTTPQNNHCL